ncbi:MBL fold metallo-hydrolase [Prauserella muralis]|uniref:MBL fold metallo-hydrolase n=1 Tax=Prauserella muralis TaxID=588067 RepID=A0A2V4AFM5_9PSEU|nr:MBL fold metallo-hydrolase [Prauserella muralis]PXY17472.1 MBL fold metallo-hydrolase [Prauserella muralis]
MQVRADDPTGNWAAPGVYRVAPGVHRIPLPLPGDALTAVNVYAVDDGTTLALIDSGQALATSRDLLAAALNALGCGLADVRRFLVTHLHRDHYTQAVALRREFGTAITLGAGEEPSLRIAGSPAHQLTPQAELLTRCGATALLRRLRGIDPRDGIPRDIWEAPNDWLTGGTTVPVGARTLDAVATPGHTRGHLVFHEQTAGILFAGDHVLPHITPSIGFEAALAPFPLRDYLGSLRLVRAMPDARLLAAHGPVTTSVHARVDELLVHHDTRLTAASRLVARGRNTAYAVADGLTWTRRERRLIELDPFNQMLAVLETKAHLDLLVLQEQLITEDIDGITHYRAP